MREFDLRIRVFFSYFSPIRYSAIDIHRTHMIFHVHKCATWLFIQNGITHKSRENNENDIFICYRL